MSSSRFFQRPRGRHCHQTPCPQLNFFGSRLCLLAYQSLLCLLQYTHFRRNSSTVFSRLPNFRLSSLKALTTFFNFNGKLLDLINNYLLSDQFCMSHPASQRPCCAKRLFTDSDGVSISHAQKHFLNHSVQINTTNIYTTNDSYFITRLSIIILLGLSGNVIYNSLHACSYCYKNGSKD